MARARLSKRMPDEDMVRLFAEHHITQVRRRKNGEITKVKHVAYGWIDPSAFYAMQKAHEFLPILEKVIEGGYRMKAALWGTTVGAATVNIPVAALLVAGATGLAAVDGGVGTPMGALDIAALALPFGEIYLMLRGVSIAASIAANAGNALANVGNVFSSDECTRLRGDLAQVEFLLSNPFLIFRGEWEAARSRIEQQISQVCGGGTPRLSISSTSPVPQSQIRSPKLRTHATP